MKIWVRFYHSEGLWEHLPLVTNIMALVRTITVHQLGRHIIHRLSDNLQYGIRTTERPFWTSVVLHRRIDYWAAWWYRGINRSVRESSHCRRDTHWCLCWLSSLFLLGGLRDCAYEQTFPGQFRHLSIFASYGSSVHLFGSQTATDTVHRMLLDPLLVSQFSKIRTRNGVAVSTSSQLSVLSASCAGLSSIILRHSRCCTERRRPGK